MLVIRFCNIREHIWKVVHVLKGQTFTDMSLTCIIRRVAALSGPYKGLSSSIRIIGLIRFSKSLYGSWPHHKVFDGLIRLLRPSRLSKAL